MFGQTRLSEQVSIAANGFCPAASGATNSASNARVSDFPGTNLSFSRPKPFNRRFL
jgi:hypothetical protein